VSREKLRAYEMLSYTWYKELSRKFSKLAVKSALVNVNDLTLFNINDIILITMFFRCQSLLSSHTQNPKYSGGRLL
jgi:hypothetical protein